MQEEEEEEISQEIILPEDIGAYSKSKPAIKSTTDNMLNDVITSIKQAWQAIVNKHHKGQLPIQLLILVVVYNFVFFQAEEGKEIYIFVPLLAVIISYAFKYWEFPRKIKYNISGGALLFGLFWDLILSITFIPTYKNWGWSYDSAPTLAADLIALFSAIVWFTNDKKIIIENTNKQNITM
ncbi:MAG: hypothetical protein GPJ54_18690 [Candidatus Heimdallarchaeota archaeon]|nr:hypothetical protein [Candidatus Heimdallarchaeota archaeon]